MTLVQSIFLFRIFLMNIGMLENAQ